jgi:hypothetical protein
MVPESIVVITFLLSCYVLWLNGTFTLMWTFLLKHTQISVLAEWLLYAQERSSSRYYSAQKVSAHRFAYFYESFTFGTEMLYVLVEYYLFVYLTQGCTNLGRQFTSKTNSVLWQLIFLSHEYGICFEQLNCRLGFWGGSSILGDFMHPWLIRSCR